MGLFVAPLPAATAVALEDIPRLLEALGLSFSVLLALLPALVRPTVGVTVLALLTVTLAMPVVGILAFALGLAILAFRLALALLHFAIDYSDIHGIRILRCC